MINLILQGIHGRMGKTVFQMIAERNDCCVVAGLDAKQAPCDVPVFSTLAECTVSADVLIDFSVPTATETMLSECVVRGLPCVVCTTGLNNEIQHKLEEAAQYTAVFQSANMSLGINVLITLVKQAAALLGSTYDVEIIEKHHHNKIDAPSGTALMLADALNRVAPQPYDYVYDRHTRHQKRGAHELGLHSIRGGSIVGEHDVLFCGSEEIITLSHSAASRDVFAAGALSAALFLAGKPAGLYSMEDLVQL